MTNARAVRLAWVGMAIATVVAYAPALRAPFLFDDAVIGESTSIRHLWPLSIPLHPGGTSNPAAGRPMVNYTLAINYAINERLGIDQRADSNDPDKTVGYHVFNLLLHLACGLLLFGVVRRTLRQQRVSERWRAAEWSDTASLLIAGVWLLHPMQTEAVDYVIQRTEIIVSACYLGTLYASIRAWDASTARRRLAWYAVAVVTCLLGMGSKEVMISAPLIVVLYDVAFRWTIAGNTEEKRETKGTPERVQRRGTGQPAANAVVAAESPWTLVVTGGRGWFYLVLCATSAWLIVLIVGGPRSDTVGFDLGLPWYQYLYSQGWAILHYVRLFLWPNHLTLDYGQRPLRGLAGVPGCIALAVFAVATIVAWTRVKAWGWFGFLGAWFFLLLAPSSSIVPITTEIAAERRIYLALVTVIVLTLVGIYALLRRGTSGAVGQSSAPRWVLVGAASVLGVLLTATTFERSETYRDVIGIWRDVVAKEPENPRGYGNLAAQMLLQTPPREDEAIALLHHELELDSTVAAAWVDLAGLASKHGQDATAEALYERALTVDPNDLFALSHLGVLFENHEDLGHAIPCFERLVALEPDAWSLSHLAIALQNHGDAERSIPYFEGLVKLQPNGLNLALLSRAFAASGHTDDAMMAARIATERSDNSAETLSALGGAELALGQRDSAVALYRRALTARSDYAPARRALDSLIRGR